MAGYLELFPHESPEPFISAINYAENQTRANSTVAPLGDTGTLSVFAGQAWGTANVIVDTNGFFR